MATATSKEIVILTDYEHVRKRPNYYVGTIIPTEQEMVIIYKNGSFLTKPQKEIHNTSMAGYKLLSEVLDNAIDEAKRCAGKLTTITVELDTSKNKITITDNGGGFLNPSEINKTSGLSNVASALTLLKAGSNFNNDNLGTENNIIGMNGVGAALVNILSSHFSVITTSKKEIYKETWENFKSVFTETTKGNYSNKTGTSVSFIPDVTMFKDFRYERDFILQQLILRQCAIKLGNSLINNLILKFCVDGEEIIIPDYYQFILSNNYTKLENEYGVFFLSLKDSEEILLDSLMLVNGQYCEGTHNRFFQDVISAKMKVPSATFGKYVAVIGFWNLKPSLTQFLDQNKSKFCTPRKELNSLIGDIGNAYDKQYTKNKNIRDFVERIKELEREEQDGLVLSEMRKAKRNLKKKKTLSTKYKGGTKGKKRLFIAEGDSAAGGILQHRKDSDGVYALRGKIPNCYRLSDFSKNAEIIELLNILDLDIEKKGDSSYENIIISTDWDNDGIGHIAGLIINFFGRWFPDILKNGVVKILQVPLRSAEIDKQVYYFYDNKEWEKFEKKNGKKIKNIRYLKGLGSLSNDDWKIILDNPKLIDINPESNYMKYLDIAFGEDKIKRKKFLAI